jgi:hypothetical protein
MGLVMVPARADGEQTSRVTQAGPVTMTPPGDAGEAQGVAACPHLSFRAPAG